MTNNFDSFIQSMIEGLSTHYKRKFNEREIENIACKIYQQENKCNTNDSFCDTYGSEQCIFKPQLDYISIIGNDGNNFKISNIIIKNW